jgi:L-serine dehydratase
MPVTDCGRRRLDGLLAAAAIGYLCKHHATLSGAEGGCQAEVGVGSSMGAAMISQALEAGPKVVSNAAESARGPSQE